MEPIPLPVAGAVGWPRARYKGTSKISRANILWAVEISMGCGGVRTPVTPDELDAGDVMQGLGVLAWRRVVGCVGLGGGF
jgi:hypothetical protein